MARKYLLVEITKDRILVVDKVKSADRKKAIKNKKENQEVLTVSSYEEGYAMISRHNLAISPKTSIVKSVTETEIKIWDWTKVKPKKVQEILQYFEVQDWFSIFEIHNDLELTDENYCCPGYVQKVKYNINKAITEGKINESTSKNNKRGHGKSHGRK